MIPQKYGWVFFIRKNAISQNNNRNTKTKQRPKKKPAKLRMDAMPLGDMLNVCALLADLLRKTLRFEGDGLS